MNEINSSWLDWPLATPTCPLPPATWLCKCVLALTVFLFLPLFPCRTPRRICLCAHPTQSALRSTYMRLLGLNVNVAVPNRIACPIRSSYIIIRSIHTRPRTRRSIYATTTRRRSCCSTSDCCSATFRTRNSRVCTWRSSCRSWAQSTKMICSCSLAII